MKTIILFLFIGLTATVNAQKLFEGVIKYDIKIEGNNTKMLEGILPKAYTFYVFQNDLRVKVDGGIMANYMSDMLYVSKTKTTYSLNADEKIAYRFADEINESNDSLVNVPKEITKTGETEKILNYECTKYQIKQMVNGIEVVEYVWVTDEIRIGSSNLETPAMQNLSVKGVDGTALKSYSTVQQNDIKFNMTIVAESVEKKTLEKTLFQLPDNYKVKEFSKNSLGF